MKDDDEFDIGEAIGVFNTLIVFISFAIVYCNILLSTGAIIVIQEWSREFYAPIKMIINIALASPAFITLWVIWEFIKELVIGSLSEFDEENKPGFFNTIGVVGFMLGIFVFVLTLSIFVAFQSDSYLQKIAPDVRKALENVLIKTDQG